MNIFLLGHAGEEHTKDPSTLIQHLPFIVGISLVLAAVMYLVYLQLSKKPTINKDNDE